MSFERKHAYLPVPDVVRGQPFVFGGDPKGNKIVYGQGKTIVVRDLENPIEGYTYNEHSVATTVAKFAPSGFYICSADVSGKVRIWDTTQEEHAMKYEYQALSGPIKDLAWSEDSKRIVVGGEGREKFGHAFLWDSGSSVGNLDGHSKPVNSIDFKQTRPFRVVTASEDTDSGFFAGPPFKLDHLNQEHDSFVNAVRFAPDGTKYITGGADGRAFIFDGKEGKLIGQVNGDEPAHKGGIYGVAWKKDSSQFATASADKTVKLWDAEGKLQATFTFPNEVEFQQLGCLWQGEEILSVGLNGEMTILDPANPSEPKRKFQGHSKAITALAVDADAGRFFGGSYDGRVSKVDAATGKVELFQGHPTHGITSLAYENGKLIAGSLDDRVTVTAVDGTAFGTESFACESQPKAVAVASGVIAVACFNHVMVIKGGAVAATKSVDFEGSAVAVSNDGSQIAVGTQAGKIVIYSASLEEQKTLDATGAVTCLQFSPDGQYLASGDAGRNLYVFEASGDWNLKMSRWKYHTSKINSLAWSPDSQHLATGSLDTNIIVWSMADWMKRITIKGAHPMHDVTQVAWLDNTTLLSGGQDAAFRTFSVTHH